MTRVRISEQTDVPYLKKWLLEPGVLRYFPMLDEREVDDSIRIWMGYEAQEAALTIVDDDNKPIGMGVIYVQSLEKLKKQSLFAIIVDAKERGKGVGTTLYKKMEERAKELGITLFHLEVYEGNPAEKLYAKLGFDHYGRHERFLKEPGGEYLTKIVMQKRLDGGT